MLQFIIWSTTRKPYYTLATKKESSLNAEILDASNYLQILKMSTALIMFSPFTRILIFFTSVSGRTAPIRVFSMSIPSKGFNTWNMSFKLLHWTQIPKGPDIKIRPCITVVEVNLLNYDPELNLSYDV